MDSSLGASRVGAAIALVAVVGCGPGSETADDPGSIGEAELALGEPECPNYSDSTWIHANRPGTYWKTSPDIEYGLNRDECIGQYVVPFDVNDNDGHFSATGTWGQALPTSWEGCRDATTEVGVYRYTGFGGWSYVDGVIRYGLWWGGQYGPGPCYMVGPSVEFDGALSVKIAVRARQCYANDGTKCIAWLRKKAMAQLTH